MKVSVAMITYNHDKFIAQAIESVLMQDTTFDYEIIIGEDCSTDKTRKIIVDFQKRYPNKIKLLLHNTNKGGSHNFLATLNHGHGEYVAFLDGDDYWTSPQKLQQQVDFLDSHPETSMCFHSVKVLHDDGKWNFHPEIKKELYPIEELLIYNPIAACAPMYRRKILRQFRWPPGNFPTIFGDWLFHVWTAQFGEVGYIDEVMGVYRIHSGGIYRSLENVQQAKMRIDTIGLMQEVINTKYKHILKRLLGETFQAIAAGYALIGKKRDGRKYLWKSLTTSPWNRRIVSSQFAGTVILLYFPILGPPLETLKKKFSPHGK